MTSVTRSKQSRRSHRRVLVTGHRGMVGGEVQKQLTSAGFEVVGLDIADGDDVNDLRTVSRAIQGCSSVVHAAALDDQPDVPDGLLTLSTGDRAQVMRTNVGGTGIVLAAAASAGVDRFVFLSSVDVLGCFMGRGTPRYLPIDDAYEVDPDGAYAWSKLAGEELCASFTQSTGSATLCLRAPGVVNDDKSTRIRRMRERTPDSEWCPYWEYGAFIDVRDLASAITAALTVRDLEGHHRLLINANDISSSSHDGPTLAKHLLPHVPLRLGSRFEDDPHAALIDSSPVRRLLNWEPQYPWRASRSPRRAEGSGPI